MQDLGVITDGSLLIRDGTIAEVGPTRRVENLSAARSAVEINAAGRVVMPGFVDSHTHLIFPPAGIQAVDTDASARAVRVMTGQRIQQRALSYLAAMARHGTTTVEAKTGTGADESAETKLLRVLSSVKGAPLHVAATFLLRLGEPDGDDGARTEEKLEWICAELLPKIRRRRFARFADVEWIPWTGCESLYGRYLEAARKLGFATKIHATAAGVGAAISAAVRHLAVSVDHAEHATAEEASHLAGSGTMATLLPTFGATGRNTAARALIEAGAPIALASNFNPRHSPALNMQTVVALGCWCFGLTPEEAVCAATINGAHALGRADKVGSLELGKHANLLILNASDYREMVHHMGTNLVHLTMKKGEVIYREADVARREAEDVADTPLWA
jgi:imidazolonepropionase